MMIPPALRSLLLSSLLTAGCSSTAGARGTLLLVGGGLDDDQGQVYARLLALAEQAPRPAGAPLRIVVATAATGPQEAEATDKRESLRCWGPAVEVAIVRRETPAAETIAAFDAASGVFFTGGDQERITARYRPDGQDTAEAAALRRLLARGGVIGGGSAGDAMMGERMFTGGSSARALRVPGSAPPHGPQLAAGMALLPWALTDSHFFERDRLGRLAVGLLDSATRVGLGVGEVAALEIDLTSGVARGLTDAETLLVDAAAAHREGDAWRGFVARLIGERDRLDLVARMASPAPTIAPRPDAAVHPVPVVEPGQNRQLASWRMFRQAAAATDGVWVLPLDGYRIVAWPNGDGEVAFDLELTPAAM